jgi:hypothetical protein
MLPPAAVGVVVIDVGAPVPSVATADGGGGPRTLLVVVLEVPPLVGTSLLLPPGEGAALAADEAAVLWIGAVAVA